MSAGQIIQWQDLFALVDDGTIPMSRLHTIEAAMHQQVRQFPDGIAFLVILPPGARPPPEEVQRSVRERLVRLGPSLLCLAYLVEGTGFKAVAARAALVGMKIFAPRDYPIYVETSLHAVLLRVLPHLESGKQGRTDPAAIIRAIEYGRLAPAGAPPTVTPRAGDARPK